MTDNNLGPLARRLNAAGLASLAEEEQRRIDSEIQELKALGHTDLADLIRDRLTRSGYSSTPIE